jgi:hypothetical protein
LSLEHSFVKLPTYGSREHKNVIFGIFMQEIL